MDMMDTENSSSASFKTKYIDLLTVESCTTSPDTSLSKINSAFC